MQLQPAKENNKPTADIEAVLKEQKLTIVERNVFGKEVITKVADAGGRKLLLKTGRFEPHQARLFELAEKLENELCFRVPAIVNCGQDWLLMEYIEGKLLNDFYSVRLDWATEVSGKIARDYQKIVNKFLETEHAGDLLRDGKRWLFSRLLLWSGPIVDAGLFEYRDIRNLADEFEQKITQKSEEFFGWAHGNIIGDHIVVAGDNLYLFDLAILPRPGRGSYDFLRALDFLFLKSPDEEKNFKRIPVWVKKYLSGKDWEELKLIFAFRAVGVLGWDILHQGVQYLEVDIEKKKELLAKFIKREY